MKNNDCVYSILDIASVLGLKYKIFNTEHKILKVTNYDGYLLLDSAKNTFTFKTNLYAKVLKKGDSYDFIKFAMAYSSSSRWSYDLLNKISVKEFV
ncbi:MAG: hypothetical protein LBD41_01935 [Clostridiales Family XIII bacterium]|jgi:hypothetical protein|nr:hypothetical protein [Clostridiales Family XIII bacterium]